MPISPGLQSIGNGELEAFIAAATPIQVENLGDRYIQLLPSHASPPQSNEAPDLTTRASDREKGWPEFVAAGYASPASLRTQLAAHEYLTPSGERGWVAVARIWQGPAIYKKAQNVEGPETRRTHDWVEEVL